eukprot:CAMPEP_0116912706 /NCGR_PEP_ID=MMETSP0467-20121206/16253_1 /TAXON_ID=283647 /ORGANISM="Mesodinium pulex, Strain SPMC105" /LENGTH=133 /DNA_ID=CAMNT_0004588751 /DNA_START=307 /DNA_END=708 /DNA_ORIENTATION=-
MHLNCFKQMVAHSRQEEAACGFCRKPLEIKCIVNWKTVMECPDNLVDIIVERDLLKEKNTNTNTNKNQSIPNKDSKEKDSDENTNNLINKLQNSSVCKNVQKKKDENVIEMEEEEVPMVAEPLIGQNNASNSN